MKAFQRVPKSLSTSVNGELPSESGGELSNVGNVQLFLLELTMEMKEDDGKVSALLLHILFCILVYLRIP